MQRLRMLILLALVLISAGALPAHAQTTPLTLQATSLQPDRQVSDFAFGNGVYVMVGPWFSVYRSTNGRSWSEIPLPTTFGLRAVEFSAGRFWALGGSHLYTSPDGLVWREEGGFPTSSGSNLRTFGSELYLTGRDGLERLNGRGEWEVVRAEGGFGAATLGGIRLLLPQESLPQILVSTGGEWAKVETPGALWPVTVVAGGDRFALVGRENGGSRLQLHGSRDGRTWERWQVPGAEMNLMNLFRYQDRFWIPTMDEGGSTDLVFYTTTDGVDWERRRLPLPVGLERPFAISQVGDDLWLNSSRELYAPNGKGGWERRFSFGEPPLATVVGGGGRWVAVSRTDELLTSADGVSWTAIKVRAAGLKNGLRWGDGRFSLLANRAIGCEAECLPVLLLSTDGLTWTEWPLPKYASFAFWAGGQAVVQAGQEIGTSIDGRTWRWIPFIANYGSSMVAFKGAYYYLAASGHGYRLERSTDLEHWSPVDVGVPFQIASLSAGDDRLLLTVGSNNYVDSSDGLTWSFHVGEFYRAMGPFLLGGPTISRDGESIYWDSVRFGDLSRAWNGSQLLWYSRYGGLATYRPPAGPDLACRPLFVDLIKIDPACVAVNWGAEAGYLKGLGGKRFEPSVPATRAEMATMLVGAERWNPEPGATLSFTDVASHWAAAGGYLQAAVAHGALNGYPDGRFYPDRLMTRAEAIKVATAALGLLPAPGQPYLDAAPSDWYTGWASQARVARLIGPEAPIQLWREKGVLEPGKYVTRAEVAILIYNMYHRQVSVQRS